MTDIDTLIATFPQQLQNNALRAAQTGVEQQTLQQNALAMQQNAAGQNALKQIYANPTSIDRRTGLPTTMSLSPLVQANPDMGLAFISAIDKIQDSQSRTALTNFKIRDEYNNIVMDNVAKPTIEYDQELQAKGIPDSQRKIMVEQKKKELLDNTTNVFALPDDITTVVANTPADSFPQRYEMNQARQKMINEGWEDKTDYGKDPPVAYKYNKFLNITTNADQSAIYKPTGIGKPEGKEVQPIQTDTFKDDSGQTQTKSFTRDTFGRPIDVNTREPYTIRGTVSNMAKASAGAKFLPAPLDAQIKKDDGTYEMRPVRQQQNPDGTIVTTYASGKESGQEVPPDKIGEIRPASAARARSAATAYINKYMEEHPNASADDVAKAAADYAVQQGGARAFLAGGKQGDSIRFIGNVVGSHLPTLETLVTGLQNNDIRAIDKVKNVIVDQFGWTGPVDFNAAKTIVGGEIVKAIQGYAGAEPDRERVLNQLSDSRTPAQLRSVIYTMRSLMAGQLAGLYRQAKTAGVSDDKFYSLLPSGAKSMLQKELGTEEEQGKKDNLSGQKFNSLDAAIAALPKGKQAKIGNDTYGRALDGTLYKNGVAQ